MANRQKVWMVGAGDLARELYGWIVCEQEARYEVLGFIDDNVEVDLRSFRIDLPIVTPEEIAGKLQGARYILGVASPAAKRSLVERLTAAGARPVTYIHPTVLLGREISIGEGTVISPRSVVCSHAVVGAWCTINAFCEIGHEVTVGDYTTLLGHNALNGRVSIGAGCTVGCGAIFHPRSKVGDGSVVGIGSVVLGRVSPGTTVFGNPAQKVDEQKPAPRPVESVASP